MNKLNVLDLFAGCGGFSCGFNMTNLYNIVSAVEFNKSAAETYIKNHPTTKVYLTNIKTINTDSFIDENPNIDIIIGGPPCQGFSVAGKRNEDDERNLLPYEYIRFVSAIKPKAFVLENVKGILSMNNGITFKNIINEFKNLNYNVVFKVLNTNDFNVPQIRERVIVVGLRKDLNLSFEFPTGFEYKPTLFDAIGDIEITGTFEEINLYNHNNINLVDQDLYYRLGEGNLLCDVRHGTNHIHSWEIQLKGECTERELLILNSIAENRRKKIYGPKDGNPLSITVIEELTGLTNIINDLNTLVEKEYLSKINDKYDIHDRKINMGLRIFDRSKPINTITTQSGEHSTYAHYSQPRNLTIRELARVQTFPDNFVFYGTIKEQETQIGNAVPPLMAKEIAAQLYNCLNNF